MKDIGLKFEYSHFYSFSFKNDTTLNCKRLFFGAPVWLKYYFVLSKVVKYKNYYLLNPVSVPIESNLLVVVDIYQNICSQDFHIDKFLHYVIKRKLNTFYELHASLTSISF